MHTLLKREKSWANTPIQRLTPDATSRLFADIFRNGRTWTKKLGEEKREEKSKKRGGRGGGERENAFFLMDEVFSCYIWREHSCEELLSTRKQAVCFRQACRAPGPTSHLYSSDTWSQPDNTCGSRARSTKKWEIFSTRTKNNPLSIPLGPLLVLIHLVSLCLVLVCVLLGRGKTERRERERESRGLVV